MSSATKPPTKPPANEEVARRGRHRRGNNILNLLPDKIISSGQKVINICSNSINVWVLNHDDSGKPVWHEVQIRRFSVDKTYKGAFYYYHVPGDDKQSQLRFRLCSTTAEFGEGEDAIGRTGKIWNIPLSRLRASPTYQPILNLIQEEYGLLESGTGAPSKADGVKSNHSLLPIVSLSPQRHIPLKQQILDVSGLHDVFLDAAPTVKDKRKKRIQIEDSSTTTDPSDSVAFPPGTVGVFYYKQSLTLPTQIGELRFSLCRDLALFDRSEDLAFPTGDPWYISVQQLRLNEQYRALRDILIRERLVKLNPHQEDPVDLQFHSEEDPLILFDLFQPFPVDLSREHQNIWVQADKNKWVMLSTEDLFPPGQGSNHAYNGRVVARFEPYPQDVGSSSNSQQQRALLALRFFEVLTTIQQLSDENLLKRPIPGQLHMICSPSGDGTPSEYRPWGLTNSDPKICTMLQRLIERATVKKS